MTYIIGAAVVSIPIRWIWIGAIAWSALDILLCSVGWGDLRQTGHDIIRILMFAATLHWIAHVNQPLT